MLLLTNKMVIKTTENGIIQVPKMKYYNSYWLFQKLQNILIVMCSFNDQVILHEY